VSAASRAFTIYKHLAAKTDTPHPITVETRIIAQRSDGSHLEAKHDLRNPFEDRVIVSVPEGVEKKVFDEVKAMSTLKVDIATYMKTWGTSRDPASGCTKPFNGATGEYPNKVVGSANLQGIETNKVQTGPTFFVWVAPSMNCQEIAHEVIWATDATPSTTRLYLDKVVWGEPDASLFAVPAGYTELSPSEAVRARLTAVARPADRIEQQVAMWKRMDARYLANRP
jgi:hypothetical protein